MQPCLHLRATPLTPRRPSGPRTCRRITCRASAGQEPGKPSPNDTNIASTAEKPTYNDSWTDILFIALCRQAYGNLSGWQSPRGWLDGPETFKGMVEVSRSLMRGRTAAEQYNAVIAGFPAVPDWFRRVFPYSKWGAELNAKITPAFFTWLVGPMKTVEVEVAGPNNGPIERQMSGVQIERCRYLEESGCVGMCVNLCKMPTQTFFTRELGMPLTMDPNFEDKSCLMTFGKVPPPLEEDAVMAQGCLAGCSTAGASSGARCPKLE